MNISSLSFFINTPIILLMLLNQACVSFERHPESGYSKNSSRSTHSGWKKSQTSVTQRSFLQEESAPARDSKSRLKQLENSLSSQRELAQYSRALPWLKNDQEKIDFLELPGFEARQKWLNENDVTGRMNRINSQMQELVDAQDIALGMPESLVKKSWGDPDSIEVSGSPQFRNFRWKYNKYVSTPDGYKMERKFVYFEGGKVVGWEVE